MKEREKKRGEERKWLRKGDGEKKAELERRQREEREARIRQDCLRKGDGGKKMEL
jgi:hypothetical protein